MNINCGYCGKSFKRRRATTRYCSRQCQSSKGSNDIEIRGNVALIMIDRKDGQRLSAMIDTADVERVRPIRWCISTSGALKYVYGFPNGKKAGPVLLHRFLTQAEPGSIVDHLNHRTLDNRRANLCVGTQSDNQRNRKGANRNNLSCGIRGVTWSKKDRRWIAHHGVGGKRKHLGMFTTIEHATAAVIHEIARQKRERAEERKKARR